MVWAKAVSSRALRFLCVLAAAGALQGCVEGAGAQMDGGATPEGTVAPPGAGRSVERDVEAPEIYQTSDEGLWDGRPSLGGVWIAASDVKDPERVIIRNLANGNFVIGALFRRERENPGPRLQVSSDAATALGMLAGAPAKLSVTALKREEATPPEPEVPQAAAPEAPAEAATVKPLPAAEEIATKPLDPVVAAAAAAIDKAEPAAAAPAGAAAAVAAAAEPEPKKGLAGIFKRKKKAEPGAPLDAVSSAPDVPRIAPPAPAAAAAPVPAPKAARDAKSFVQVGIFSVEANADRAVAMLKKAGVAASVRKSSASGKAYWRVLAGPAPDKGARDGLLGKVKGLGFPDAYLVSG